MGVYVAAVLGGALSFIAYFHYGEHHLYSATYFTSFLAICGTSAAYLAWVKQGYTVLQAIYTISWTATFFLIGVYGSCLLYRINPIPGQYQHPLNKFPGPFGAKISSLWLSFQLVKRQQAHITITELHKKYGPIVRVGSNDLSITHPKAVEKIHGTSSKCSKSPFYDLNHPITSIQTTRDKALHEQRRRAWAAAIDQDSVEDSEISTGGVINVTRLINLYAFDVMGEVAYGTHFNMLITGKNHRAVSLLNESMALMGFMAPIWLIRFAVAVPGLTSKWWEFVEYCFGQMQKCRQSKMDMPIIASTLLSQYKEREPSASDMNLLQGEAQLLVVAGSDTTSAALTCALYQLARNTRIQSQLREAISASLTASHETEIKAQRIQNIDLLNGIINESLRLYPPVPTSLWRDTPPEGLWIDDETYIPGNVTVSTPQYVLGRSSEVFEESDAFIPERWYSRPEMVKQGKAYAPFNIGTHSCVGKPLAMLNMRLTLAQLVHTYEFEFATTTTENTIIDEEERKERAQVRWEESIKDTFTLVPGQLHLRFKKRTV
ncbi:hypothetical protein UA08_04265 [Talaromyces atroroseus]|uniref:Tryprostatin B 6-hydroxylase n=1 Tax=Talaromyces atroroseus TaxID=1441469 RepID=A0A1Q5Q8Q1_TALAT|nr:hypothetical protein UA08_04265 [Talaromyces atroroseus]OKL60513.1 hypothetical protein UA08_04265 [Talaromyces atroroseus]